jgi:anthranilate phosphoribosyltransferase
MTPFADPAPFAITPLLETVMAGGHLAADDMAAAVDALIEGRVSEVAFAGLMVALRMKGETADELVGVASALRGRAIPVPVLRTPELDTAGTGGDGAGSLNLSTAAALIAAADGVVVAKHGNRAASSRCGSADLCEALGIAIALAPDAAAEAMARVGFAFLFAPAYHPAIKAVAQVRRQLAVRTLFNLIGPLVNPARPKAQLVGVFAPDRLRLMAEALVRLGCADALVVAADAGLDEIAPCGSTRALRVVNGRITDLVLTPADFGQPETPLDAIAGGDPATNATILRALLGGADHPARPAVLMNAGAALVVAGRASGFAEGAKRAAELIDGGAVQRLLAEVAAPS